VPAEVAHTLPGRVRLRLPAAHRDQGSPLAAAFARHPAVTAARWSAASRSLTVSFDGEWTLPRIALGLDVDGAAPLPAPAPEVPVWRRYLVPAVSLAVSFSGLGLIARAAIAVCALPIGLRGVRSVLARELSIDVLDTAAVSLLLLTGDVVAAGVTVALVEAGERMRDQAAGRARRILRGSLGADARMVRVVRRGTEPRLPVDQVAPGDRVVVYAGENVPVDGQVLSGSGSVDNQTWTGEWRPVPVRRGLSLLAGSTLVDGRVVLRVTATGDETRAGRLAAAIEDAVAADTEMTDLAGRVANRFVLPLVLTAGGIYALTRDLGRLVSVLIIEFGTGVRISIPTVVLTTMVAAARRGVLFKRGRAIEALAEVDTIVFDKTGTLTEGRPSVAGVTTVDGLSADECLRLAATAEGHLPHPLARAIRRAARRRELTLSEPEDVRYVPGGGVRALVDGHEVLVGDRRLFESFGTELPEVARADSSVAFVGVDGRVAARIQIRDRVKRSAADAVARLRAAGIERLLLATGDHSGAARPVADGLGLDDCLAEVMPEAKAALVRRLQDQGRRVAVVGDGMNDASAMAVADVAVAVSSGADLARDTADVTLLTDELHALVTAVELARSARRLVRENIGLVAVPNGAALTVAVTGGLPPVAAAVINNGSTVLAATNGLRPLLGSGRQVTDRPGAGPTASPAPG
jgi:P-type Cu2+ transporter